MKDSRKPAPNDQRSDVFNPTSPAHKAALDNRSRQLNPKDAVYDSSHGLPPRSGDGARGGRGR